MQELIEKYGVKGYVKLGENRIPILDVKMMDPEKEKQLAIERAMHNYEKFYGKRTGAKKSLVSGKEK